MAFRLPKGCRKYFAGIFDSKATEGAKLKLFFDEYYLCLLVGFAKRKFDPHPELEGELVDNYPQEYTDSIDYIAGLLIATEKKHRGISETDAAAIEKLMADYIDSHSRTKLTSEGQTRLNQYAAYGFEVIKEEMIGEHTNLSEFYLDYFECFNTVFVEE